MCFISLLQFSETSIFFALLLDGAKQEAVSLLSVNKHAAFSSQSS